MTDKKNDCELMAMDVKKGNCGCGCLSKKSQHEAFSSKKEGDAKPAK